MESEKSLAPGAAVAAATARRKAMDAPLKLVAKAVFYLALAAFAVVAAFPYYWLFVGSFKESGELFVYPPTLIPQAPTLNNYAYVLEKTAYVRWFGNSLLLSVVHVVTSLFFCSLAGFGFAKYEFWGKKVFYTIVIGSMMIPFQIIVIPLYVLMIKIGWVDKYESMIIPWMASAFGIFLMRQYLISLPSELLDASRIDGASEFKIFYKVILPLAKPALGALAIFQFLGSWNSFLWPLIILRSMPKWTLPVGIAGFLTMGGMGPQLYGPLTTASFVTALPIIILFLLMQRQFISGLTVGSVKG